MVQAVAGYLLVCSQRGVFAYDGRVFQNLGRAQGLRDGGIVLDLGLTRDGRIAVRYPDEIFVSNRAVTLDRPPTSLVFRATDLHGAFLYDETTRQLASTTNGLALIVGRRVMRVVAPPSGGQSFLAPIDYNRGEQADLDRPAKLFSVRGAPWVTFADGRVCSADPGTVRCFGPKQGLAHGPWSDVVAGSGGTVLARSRGFLATIDPLSGSVSEEALPDQGGAYLSWGWLLGLFHTPAGELVTQSADGLIVHKRAGWVPLTTGDGMPAGLVTSVLSDSNGQLWIQVFGRGLFRGLGYGHWEGLQNEDGLSQGIAWQVVRTAGGLLWASTDAGVDELKDFGGAMHVARVISGPAFALAVGAGGELWSSAGDEGARRIDPASGIAVRVPMPEVSAITVGKGARVWFGTERGLFSVEDRRGIDPMAVRDGTSPRPVVGVLSDGSGGVWLLSEGRLWHRRADGARVAVTGRWPPDGFEPEVMAAAPDGEIWIGGAGGLYECALSGDKVADVTAVPQSGIGVSEVDAVIVDHRGWVWAGTGQGVFVFNGHRWVSVDSTKGLVWDDVSQGGICDDPDGSVWIATAEGLSHLLDPASLFAEHPVRVVISEAMLGPTRLPVHRLGYSTAPLSVQFGTFSYASEQSIVFRYRMSGVDAGWAESSSGTVRYASVPPGRHVLTVAGYNTMSHAVSTPVTLTISMAYPWWRRWWAELLYFMAAAALLYGFVKLRERASTMKTHELERLVEARTRDMRTAQAELQRQATLDGLTGLLTRTEVQRRLAERLSRATGGGDMLVAMADIDHFKRINDGYGHLAGDEVIRAVGIRVAAVLREGEYAGRYGGEELLVVLDDRDGRGADRVLDFHQSVRGAACHVGGASIPVTCSIGVAWAGPGDDWQSLVGRADTALYEAKSAGRDRIVESGEDQTLNPFAWPSVASLRSGGLAD